MPKIAILLAFFVVTIIFVPSVYADANLVINEFLANQSSDQDEWVEFYNPDYLDLTGYWIDDDIDFVSDSGNSSKKQLTASNLNVSNPTLPYATLSSSMFNDTCGSSCDYVALFSPDGSIVDQFQYTSEMIKQEGKTIGRSPDGSDAFTVLSSQTKGSQNSIPQPSPTPTPPSTPAQSASSTSSKSKSPSPSPKSSPLPTSSKKTTSVLGSSKSAEVLRSPVLEVNLSASPTPSAEPKAESSNKLKIAGAVAGSGAIVMGVSVGLYLWYRRSLRSSSSQDSTAGLRKRLATRGENKEQT